MGLPSPIPDNPLRWEGWKQFSSDNFYERLCLSFEGRPTATQIEDHCRQLMAWWQKKLPLKSQPSNPLAQLLRAGLDEAPLRLAEARSVLLDPAGRAKVDAELLARAREGSLAEFNKFLAFVLTGGELHPSEEENLYTLGEDLGLTRAEMKFLVDEELERWGMKRVVAKQAPEAPASPVATGAPAVTPVGGAQNPREEFLRMLRLSGIDELTDDQRDAFCNMGEALGLSGGDAEDLIDEYMEDRMAAGIAEARASVPVPKSAPSAPKPSPAVAPSAASTAFSNSPAVREREVKANPNFTNCLGMEMRLAPSGSFMMGSKRSDAAPNEQPVTKTNISAFYLARWPVTNAQYEQFDPSHRVKRASWGADNHPVVYVSALEAGSFCEWLSARERRKYRLPTEAEWEYAACGTEERGFPWGNTLKRNDLANFADVNKNLPWADRSMNCGFAGTSPVGSFPDGASPFGIEDMAGNVWEWCQDCMTVYPGKERTNPRGATDGPRRVYRGGSWKARAANLRVSARNCNAPAFSANDVGFRVVCEVK